MSGLPPALTGSTLDRADQWRVDPDRLREAAGSLSARLLRLERFLDPVDDGAGALSWGSMAEAEPDAELIFLGLESGRPRFVAVPPPGVPIDARGRAGMPALASLAPDQAATYAAARSLVDWHARHRHCAMCGGATHLAKGGWQRSCEACRAEHFPRTDPVVIMLAEHDGAVLVGRQAGWPRGRYSALAGFVEPGESIEDAVARELFEEAGVRATSVRYIASQPWPFPSQLMIACMAAVDARELTLDTTEIEHALWATRAEVEASLSGDPAAPFIAPPPLAIAHHLLRQWVEA